MYSKYCVLRHLPQLALGLRYQEEGVCIIKTVIIISTVQIFTKKCVYLWSVYLLCAFPPTSDPNFTRPHSIQHALYVLLVSYRDTYRTTALIDSAFFSRIMHTMHMCVCVCTYVC